MHPLQGGGRGFITGIPALIAVSLSSGGIHLMPRIIFHYATVFTSFYPRNVLTTFSIGGRAEELLVRDNVHPHPNNYSRHMGLGNWDADTSDEWQNRALRDGHAVRELPHRAARNTPYIEAVWNLPGDEAGAIRLIYNANNTDEMYFTDDHYTVYWIVRAHEVTRQQYED
jgi:hypothetical protein